MLLPGKITYTELYYFIFVKSLKYMEIIISEIFKVTLYFYFHQ